MKTRPGVGPEVVLLHGIPGSGATWDRVIAALPPSVPLVVPDLLGFGASDRAIAIDDLHAEGQARRLQAVIDRLGLDRPVLVAHDFGGPVALRLLMARPEGYGGLVLSATNAFADTPIPFPLSLTVTPVIGSFFGRLMFSRLALRGLCRRAARLARVDTATAVGDRRQARAIATIFHQSLLHLSDLYSPIQSFLASVAVPTAVLWGERDPVFRVADGERTAAAIQGASLEVIEGCGHFIPIEAPQQMAATIEQIRRRS